MYSRTATINAGVDFDIDMVGALDDPLGDQITAVRVKSIFFKNISTNDTDIILGGAVANAFAAMWNAVGDSLNIPRDGYVLLTAPDATAWVTAGGATDILRITGGAANGEYEITIVMASA